MGRDAGTEGTLGRGPFAELTLALPETGHWQATTYPAQPRRVSYAVYMQRARSLALRVAASRW